MGYLIGAVAGLVFLGAYWRASRYTLAQAGYLAITVMLAIYLGAYLVTGPTSRLAAEFVFACIAAAAALWLSKRWPLGIGLMILAHAGYDLFLGHNSGIAAWYPGACVGFDVAVGLGFTFLFVRSAQAGEQSSR